MSYKETKQHRNNLAKLAIISSEQYGISLPIHFSPIQFILVAMNDLDHSNEANFECIRNLSKAKLI